MVPTVHKPVHVMRDKTKQQNVTKLQQLFLQQKFISLAASWMNKLILFMIIMKKLDVLYKKYESNFPVIKHSENRKKFSLLKRPLAIPFVQGRMSYDV